MNLFTTDAFLEAAGEAFFPSATRRIETFRCEGRLLRLLEADGKVVRSMPFYDFPQPLQGPEPTGVRPLPYFPRTVLRTTTVEERTPEPPGQQPSPYIEWARFKTFEELEKHAEARGARWADSRRQRRRIEKDLGALSFVFSDDRPEVFEQGLKWKSAQYQATNVQDMFATPANVELFKGLQRRGALLVSSLSAGATLLAVHVGALTDKRVAWWVPAYDGAFNKYSPGRLLLEDIMKASHEKGHLEFDFLLGDEGYKFMYATNNRVVGPVGEPPLREQLATEAKKRAKAFLEKYPMAYGLAKEARRRVRGY